MTYGVFGLTLLLVVVAVIIHYEALARMAAWLPALPLAPRRRAIFGILGAIAAHLAEVWVFAAGYYLLLAWPHHGTLVGDFTRSLLDCAYFSFVTYTSLGLGDIAPQGAVRILVGVEALTGLVLIAWTASFLFLLMQRDWRLHRRKRERNRQVRE